MVKEAGRSRAYSFEDPGRKSPIEDPLFSKLSDALADKVSPDVITVIGAAAGVLGSYFLASQDDSSRAMSRRQAKTAGAVLLGISYFCDLLDGAVARKSEKGPTPHGKILDGIVNKIVDGAPGVFMRMNTNDPDEKATWLMYLLTAPIPTTIRARGIAHDIPISKVGLGARVERVPILLAGLMFKDKRNLAGKILSVQAIASTIVRYREIQESGNEEAVKQANRDILEHLALFALGRKLTKNPLHQDLLSLGLGIAKLGQVKIAESKGNI